MRIIGILATGLLVACGGGGSDNDVLAVPAPKGLAIENDGLDLTIEWQPISGSAKYNLYYAQEPIGSIDNYAAYEGGTLLLNVGQPYSLALPAPEHVYHFRVSAVRGGIESAGSASVKVAPRYKIEGELIRDLTTDYLWTRCLDGQSWDEMEEACTGTPNRITLAEAKTKASALGMSVPVQHQLLSLTYCESGDPAYFPNDVPGSNYACNGVDQARHPLFRIAEYETPEVTTNTGCSAGTTATVNFVQGRVVGCGSTEFQSVNARYYKFDP